jgi:hypothetical protein
MLSTVTSPPLEDISEDDGKEYAIVYEPGITPLYFSGISSFGKARWSEDPNDAITFEERVTADSIVDALLPFDVQQETEILEV